MPAEAGFFEAVAAVFVREAGASNSQFPRHSLGTKTEKEQSQFSRHSLGSETTGETIVTTGTKLPTEWSLSTLSELVLNIQYGHTASASEERIGPRFLRITDLQNNSVDWSRVPFCECEEVEKYILKPGDIVIARTGATTGKSFLLSELPEDTIFASYLIRLSTSESFPPDYLGLFMQSPDYWRQITVVSKGSAQPGANAKILSGLQIPVAPLNEQRRIVEKIEALSAHSRNARQALDAIPALLEQFRQSVLAAAFRGDLTADWRAQHPDVEPASAFAEFDCDENGWAIAMAKDACLKVQSGSTPKGKPFTENGDVPFLKVYNIVNQKIDFNYRQQFVSNEVNETGSLKRSIVFPNDVLINIVGPPLATLRTVLGSQRRKAIHRIKCTYNKERDTDG